MMRNSFKELEELEMQNVSMPNEAIKNGITSDIGIVKYISTVMEMYFPRVIDLFVGLAGGRDNDKEQTKGKKYPDLN